MELIYVENGTVLAVALGAYLTYKVVRSIGGPIMSTWTNQQLETDVRATGFSMSAQVDAFGQVASGPLMGLVATRTSVRVALAATAALLTPPQAVLTRVAFLSGDRTSTPPESNAPDRRLRPTPTGIPGH